MEQSRFLNIIFLFFGVLIFAAALFNWNYFFKQRKAQILTRYFGTNGTRVIYALLGLFFALVGANNLFNLHLLPF